MSGLDRSRGTSGGTPAESEAVPRVALGRWDAGGWALVVQPGSDSNELRDAVANVPAGLEFAEAYGDVEVVLVFRAPDVLPSRRGCLGVGLRSAIGGRDDDDAARQWMTDGERHAYQAGRADGLDAVARAVLDVALESHKPERRR